MAATRYLLTKPMLEREHLVPTNLRGDEPLEDLNVDQPSTLSRNNTDQARAKSNTTFLASTDRAGIFTGQDIDGAVLIAMIIWGPLAAGAFLRS